MSRLGLASIVIAPLALGCFQTDCPETKARILDKFTPGSETFDPDLLSPPPAGSAATDFQAILDSGPDRCVTLDDEFRDSAINGIEGEVCDAGDIGQGCSVGGQVCHRATESTLTDPVFECRQACVDENDDSCPAGTACINLDDNDDGVQDGFRCDNPNLGACQAMLRAVSEPRCVQCDEMELLVCECRSGASLFECVSRFVQQEGVRDRVAAETCAQEATVALDSVNDLVKDDLILCADQCFEGALAGNEIAGNVFADCYAACLAGPGGGPVQLEFNNAQFEDCFARLSEANSVDERQLCSGVKANISRLDDGITPDCSSYEFPQANGLTCGNELECIGERCLLLDDAGADPAAAQVCGSSCGQDDGAGGLKADLDRCETGISFCSDLLVDRDGNPAEPGCVPLVFQGDPADPADGYTFEDFPVGNCAVGSNDCYPGECQVIPVPGAGNVARCTFSCDSLDSPRCGQDAFCSGITVSGNEGACAQVPLEYRDACDPANAAECAGGICAPDPNNNNTNTCAVACDNSQGCPGANDLCVPDPAGGPSRCFPLPANIGDTCDNDAQCGPAGECVEVSQQGGNIKVCAVACVADEDCPRVTNCTSSAFLVGEESDFCL